jgi:hypothetical protein
VIGGLEREEMVRDLPGRPCYVMRMKRRSGHG